MVVVDLLFVKALCLGLVLLCSAKCPFWVCNNLNVEERVGCFILIVFPVSFDF